MNLLRQREKLKDFHRLKLLDVAHLHRALQAPVFVWDLGERNSMTKAERQYIQEFVATGDSNCPTVAPFDCFRISMREGFVQCFFYPEEKKWFLVGVHYEGVTLHDSGRRNPEFWTFNTYSTKAGHRCTYMLYGDGKLMTHKIKNEDGTIKPEFRQSMQAYMSWLSLFICDLEHPKNVIIKVTPEHGGRSVLWQMTREHYLIINRNQAGLCRDQKRGPSDQQLIRGAHHRIAHTRRLMSPKFTHKRGQVIRVKAAWVGPDEWIGLDKKIYKVIHL